MPYIYVYTHYAKTTVLLPIIHSLYLGNYRSNHFNTSKVNYLESNHHDFGITGTFGNPGPLGGLLAVCWIVSIFFIYENIQNKHRILTLSFCMIACFILYGLLLSGSRAGWTAALVGSMIFLWQWLKRKHTIKVKPTLLKSGFLLIITVFIISIYFIRRDSADATDC